MPRPETHVAFLAAALTAAPVALAQAAPAEQAFCPSTAHVNPTKTPADLVAAVAGADLRINSPEVKLPATLGAEPISAFSTWSIPRHFRRPVARNGPSGIS